MQKLFGICDFVVIALTILLLQSCAASKVSRGAETQIDNSYKNASSMFDGSTSLTDAYQNSSQAAKGAMLGGAAGVVAGSVTPGIGWGPGLLGGSILGGAFGAYIDSNTTFKDRLENRGVKVITLGDQLLFVLMSDSVFYGITPKIRAGAYSTLDMIAEYINQYPNISVKVSAYTNDTGSSSINRSLSQSQAENIVKYLWRKGVNTRFLYAIGNGGTHLVEKNTIEWNESANYRIEISLEKLPV